MRGWFVAFYLDETGATTVEYALIAALMVAASALVVSQLRQSAEDSFIRHKSYFEGAK